MQYDLHLLYLYLGANLLEGGLLCSFEQLNTIMLKKDPDLNLVCAAARRAVMSLVTSLGPILRCAATKYPDDSNANTLKAAVVLVPRLITSVLPLFGSESANPGLSDRQVTNQIEDLLRQLSETLIYPLVSSFYSLSQIFLSTLLSRTKPKSSSNTNTSTPCHAILDFRPQIFALLQILVASLRTVYVNSSNRVLSAQLYDLFQLVTLRTVRDLDSLYSDQPNPLGTPYTPYAPCSPWSRSAFLRTEYKHRLGFDHMPTENLGEIAPWAASTPDRSRLLPRGGIDGGDDGGVTGVTGLVGGAIGTGRSQQRSSTQGLGTNPKPDMGQGDRGKADTDRVRIQRLARKEAMWYLCNVVHLMFSEMDEIECSMGSNEEGVVVNEAVGRHQMGGLDGRDQSVEGHRALDSGMDRSDGMDKLMDRDQMRDQHGQRSGHQHHRRHQEDTLAMSSLGTGHYINIDPSSFSSPPSGPHSTFSEPSRQDYQPHRGHLYDQDTGDKDNPPSRHSQPRSIPSIYSIYPIANLKANNRPDPDDPNGDDDDDRSDRTNRNRAVTNDRNDPNDFNGPLTALPPLANNIPNTHSHDTLGSREITGTGAYDYGESSLVNCNSLERNLTGVLLGEAVIATLSGLLRRTGHRGASSVAVCHTTEFSLVGGGSEESACEVNVNGVGDEEGNGCIDEDMSVSERAMLRTVRREREMKKMRREKEKAGMDEVESGMVMAVIERAWLRIP